ncbi:MAG: NADH-quinone oxidoreductase subunit B family protein [Chloroflexi bacterium]|nr:NADH-quinone oxidoreductase subunit B family protein [Chloroflexota bacterium]
MVDATALSANGDHQPDPECGVAADQIATVSNVTQRPLTAGLAIPIQRLPALTNGSHTADPDSPARLAADVSRLNGRIRALLRRSLHVRHLDAGSCNGCDWEIGALTGAIYDVQRLGVDVVASPRHADAVLVTGIVTRHLEPALLATYEAMPRPGLVIAVGACACGGGPFEGSYAVVGPVDRRLPVDVYIPGCPPRPHALIHGLLVAMDRLAPKLARSELTIPADTP